MEIGLLIIRLALGLTLFGHGAQKLLGWFGGGGLKATGGFFEQMGFRPGRLYAGMAGLGEVTAGLMLAAGLLTPLASTILIAVMLVATVTLHLGKGFFLSTGGYEYTLMIGLMALGLAATGPGSLSLDAALGLNLSGAPWAGFALVAGLIGGAVPLMLRPQPEPVSEPATGS